jgi:hypothetical protein
LHGRWPSLVRPRRNGRRSRNPRLADPPTSSSTTGSHTSNTSGGFHTTLNGVHSAGTTTGGTLAASDPFNASDISNISATDTLPQTTASTPGLNLAAHASPVRASPGHQHTPAYKFRRFNPARVPRSRYCLRREASSSSAQFISKILQRESAHTYHWRRTRPFLGTSGE